MVGALGIGIIAALVFHFSRRLLARAGEPRSSVAACLALALLVLVPTLLTWAAQNLVVAVLVTGAAAAIGLAVLRGPSGAAREGGPDDRAPVHLGALAFSTVALVLVAWAALRGHWWDEAQIHFGLTSIIARGVVPPIHPLFPDEVFSYHYGYDVLAAIVRAFVDLRVEWSLDVVTITCFVLLLWVSASFGQELAGKVGASLAIVLVPFGSSLLQYPLFGDMNAMHVGWSRLPASWSRDMPPPVISNFFQHAQGLGMPLALAVLLLFTSPAPSASARRWRAVIGGALLGALSLCQAIFFLTLGLMLGAGALFRAFDPREGERATRMRTLAVELAALLGSLAIAAILPGGFFGPTSARQELDFSHTYFHEPFITNVAHHFVIFGLPLLAIPLYLWRIVDRPTAPRAALLVGVLVGFTLPNLVTYKSGWDIVKFYGIAAFFANLLFADVLARALSAVRAKVLVRAGVSLALAFSVLASFAWLVRMSAMDGRFGVNPMQFGPPPPVAEAVFQKLRDRVAPRERVFSTNTDMSFAGFVTPGFSYFGQGAYVYMMNKERVDELERRYTAARHHLHLADLDALRVTHLILSNGDESSLSPEGQAALRDPARFEHLFDVEAGGDVRHVYRVLR